MFRRTVTLDFKSSFFLFGARGTGKSTLLKSSLPPEIAQSTLWIDLLLPKDEEAFSKNPQLLLERILGSGAKTVVIDEVQKIPKLLDVAHYCIENHQIVFGLTGSSARKLKRQGANLLAGRAYSFHLDAFSYFELRGEKNVFDLDRALQWGMLPKIFGGQGDPLSDPDKMLYLESYTRTYLREEIQLEQEVRQAQAFRSFLEIAAQMNGKILNYSKIARDVGVDDKTVKTYFEILEDTFLGFLLPAFQRSVRKRQGTKPKFYLFDPGIKRALESTLDIPLRERTQAYGHAFEHFVILECFKLNAALRKNMKFSYLITKDDAEVDLIVELPGGRGTYFIEIKSADHVPPEDVRSIEALSQGVPGAQALILSRESAARQVRDVRILPWVEGLALLFGIQ